MFQRRKFSIAAEKSEKAVDASRDKLRLWGLTDEQIKNFEATKQIMDHVTTYSPMEGVVTTKHVDEGAYVKEGSVVYNISNLDYLWVELDAYESDLQWLHYAQEVSFTTEAWPGEEFKGRVSFIHPILNNKTRTVKVRVNVDNKDRRLKPDMFVRAEVRVNINAAGQVKCLINRMFRYTIPQYIILRFTMAHLFEDNQKLKTRIRKIKGQLEAVEKSLDKGGDCYKVLQTLTACRGAMNGLLGEIVESHIKEHIMNDAANPKTEQDKEALALIKLLKTYWK